MFKYMWKEIFGESASSKLDRMFTQLVGYIHDTGEEIEKDMENMENNFNSSIQGVTEMVMALALIMKVKPSKLAEMIGHDKTKEYKDKLTVELEEYEEEYDYSEDTTF
jgi:hypothetical protein